MERAGSLPRSWGSAGSMANLSTIDLAYNNLAGTLPAWKEAGGYVMQHYSEACNMPDCHPKH